MPQCHTCRKNVLTTNTYSFRDRSLTRNYGISFIELCKDCEKDPPHMFTRHFFKSDYEKKLKELLERI